MQEFVIQAYPVQTLPKYRQPIVEKLIMAGVFESDLESYDALACEIFDAIVEGHLLDAHLRANIPPESHD